jgi:hypothetical protein
MGNGERRSVQPGREAVVEAHQGVDALAQHGSVSPGRTRATRDPEPRGRADGERVRHRRTDRQPRIGPRPPAWVR